MYNIIPQLDRISISILLCCWLLKCFLFIYVLEWTQNKPWPTVMMALSLSLATVKCYWLDSMFLETGTWIQLSLCPILSIFLYNGKRNFILILITLWGPGHKNLRELPCKFNFLSPSIHPNMKTKQNKNSKRIFLPHPQHREVPELGIESKPQKCCIFNLLHHRRTPWAIFLSWLFSDGPLWSKIAAGSNQGSGITRPWPVEEKEQITPKYGKKCLPFNLIGPT